MNLLRIASVSYLSVFGERFYFLVALDFGERGDLVALGLFVLCLDLILSSFTSLKTDLTPDLFIGLLLTDLLAFVLPIPSLILSKSSYKFSFKISIFSLKY
jgi:hypothetical protein